MEILSRNGGQFRTRLMDHQKAHNFSRCLQANPNFDGVMVYESDRAKGDRRWMVVYHPANPERLQDILARQESAREARAMTEGHGYLFLADESSQFFYCLSVSQEVYEVSDLDCSCPDREFRGRAAGVPCKHMLALRNRVGEIVQREAPLGCRCDA